ncbi:MAG: hypothetical protein ABIQ16_02085, partial [Polyangiaceae bacterium]
GAAPVSAGLQAWCEAAGLRLRMVYGQTELTGATSIGPRMGASFGAVGLPMSGVALRLAPDGELLVHSGTRFSGYLGDDRATAFTLQGSWLRTGDRARLLPSGELVLLGRVQGVMRNVGGTTVDTAEIAAALCDSFGAAEYVFAQVASGACLYVALPSASAARLEPLAAHDARWEKFAASLAKADPQQLVSGFALSLGKFREAYGEVGPTGKPRSHRIHALHESQIRLRAHFIEPPAGLALPLDVASS